MVRPCGEKDRGKCSNENMEDDCERNWNAKDRTTKTKICYTKRCEETGVQKGNTISKSFEKENLMRTPRCHKL